MDRFFGYKKNISRYCEKGGSLININQRLKKTKQHGDNFYRKWKLSLYNLPSYVRNTISIYIGII